MAIDANLSLNSWSKSAHWWSEEKGTGILFSLGSFPGSAARAQSRFQASFDGKVRCPVRKAIGSTADHAAPQQIQSSCLQRRIDRLAPACISRPATKLRARHLD